MNRKYDIKLSQFEIKKFSEVACSIAISTGAILKDNFEKPKQIKFKGRIDPVTNVDLKADRFITKSILKEFPHHSILTEEEGHNKIINLGSEFKWIIDPLDGTVNYSHRFPVYCVSIALEYRGSVIVGAVYDPERDELFSAMKGKGAYLNKRKISVSKEKQLHRALLATGFSYDVATIRKNNLGLFARMVKKAQAVRRAGSAALDICWMASGRVDGFWELYLSPWDVAAATLIATEAGGKTTGLDGKNYSIYGNNLLASNGLLHNKMKSILSP